MLSKIFQKPKREALYNSRFCDLGAVKEKQHFYLIISMSKRKDEEKVNTPKVKKKTSNIETLLHIIKTNIGIGILALPRALSQVGLLTGFIGIVLLSAIAVYCMHLLLIYSKELTDKINERAENKDSKDESDSDEMKQLSESENIKKDTEIDENATNAKTSKERRSQDDEVSKDKNHESEKSTKIVTSLDYQATVEQAFRFGPKKVRSWSYAMRQVINVLLILTQLGFCCGYSVFAARNIDEVAHHLHNTSLHVTHILLIEWPIMIALNLIPNLQMLAILSVVSIAMQTVALAMMCGFFFTGERPKNIIYYINQDVSKWPLYFGTVMFSLESIAVILPIENAMREQENFRGWFGILNLGMLIVVCIYLFVGGAGYAKYGEESKGSITLNIDQGTYSEVIRIMFALAIFMSYPLQMYVPFTFILPFLREKFIKEDMKKWKKYGIEVLFRAAIVSLTFGIAIAIPMLDLVITLVGSFTGTGLAMIMPPVIEFVCTWNATDKKYKTLILTSDVLIFIFGIFGLCTGFGVTIKEMIDRIKSGKLETNE